MCVILFSILLCVFLLCVSFFSCVSFSSMCPYSLVYLKFLSSLGCVLLSVCLYTRVVFQCLVRCLKSLLDELFENLASQLIKSYHILSYHILSLLDKATKNVNRFTSSRAAPSTSPVWLETLRRSLTTFSGGKHFRLIQVVLHVVLQVVYKLYYNNNKKIPILIRV